MKILKMLLKIIIILAVLAVIAATIGIACSQKLTAAEYTEPLEGVAGSVKIVFLSDLHGREFGDGNCELTELIKEQKPDIIAVVGDLINRDSGDEEIEKMCAFLEKLPEIAPTYFSIGNHEADYISESGDDVLNMIRAADVTVLDCEYEELTINGTTFRLGGMSQLAYYGGDGKYDPEAEAFLTDYCDTELPKVMLSHRPEAFCFKYACRDWDVDLIFSGHTHGGLVRLPVIGGLVAPIQGLFPDFYYGEYSEYNSKIIITSGLAGYYWAPRMYNPPEICVVTITAKG